MTTVLSSPARPASTTTSSSVRVALAAFVAALALLVIAVANSFARNQNTAVTTTAFYVAVVLVLVAFMPGLLSRTTPARQRTALVVLFSAAMYLIKVLYEPSRFALHDELAQTRGVRNLLSSHHLFGANPIVRAYPYFPGLNSATTVMMHTTHLSQFWSGVVVIGTARLIGGLALYEVLRRLVGHDRLAAAGVLLYATNPNFLYFDAAYSYESLAIPLALGALLCAVLASKSAVGLWRCVAVAAVLTAGLVLTHHVTAYWLAAVLVGWMLVAAVQAMRHSSDARASLKRVWPFALIVVVGVLAWQLGVARSHTASEIDPALAGARALIDKLTGRSSGPQKQLFASGTGQIANPLWAQAVALAAVALSLIILVLGLWAVVRRVSWRHPLVIVLSVLSILLPVTLALRVTQEGTETSNRASEFVYFGLALAGAAVLASKRRQDRAAHERKDRADRGKTVLTAFGVAVVVMFIGGFVIGWAPYERQPGPYLGAAELRSVDPPSMQAARWAAGHIPARTFIAADLSNGLLMAAYATLNPQNGSVNGRAVSTLFYSTTYSDVDRQIVSADKIRYIVVDTRMSEVPPQSKGYFAFGVPPGVDPAEKLLKRSLSKFDRTSSLQRVYDNGIIRIYSVTTP